MRHVLISTKTFRDNSAKSINLQTLLIDNNGVSGILEPLFRYQLKNKHKSKTWHSKLLQAMGLLLDYMEANQFQNSSPKEFFEMFVVAIFSGTINEQGEDPSGLYWLPKRISTGNMLVTSLSSFSDWLYEEYGAVQLNPWRKATKYEEKLNWMAQIHKSHHNFLGHLDNAIEISETAKRARNVIRPRGIYSAIGNTKAFPEDKIHELLWVGFKHHSKVDNLDLIDRYNWRDIAITILMHGGGIRHSEAFHLWIQDVYPDPDDPNMAVVRIYHPSEGKAPDDFKDPRTGKVVNTRESYLLLKYGLLPRNQYAANDKRFAGWKNPMLDNDREKYMHIYWFPKDWGYIFMYVWKMYMAKRIRLGIKDNHPYAFVNESPQYMGEMMPIRTQRESYDKAIVSIGLIKAKGNGTTPHAHRHAYGQRLENSCIELKDKKKIIKKAMHHKSIESQAVYTEPSISAVSKVLNQASDNLQNGITVTMEYEIEDWLNDNYKTKYKKWR